ncbi:MAG: DUF1592 domain-containing protein, partial [Verrucomicrobia bacterium]|nr:DUF1592 domain-containing protein [Verrucomicrobiota bacterium]
MMHCKWIQCALVLLVLLTGVFSAGAATNPPTLDELKALGARQSLLKQLVAHSLETNAPLPELDRFRREIEPVLQRHCVACHGPKKTKAHLRIDTLNPNLLEGPDVDWWLEILAVLGNGEMPPPDESKLSGEDRSRAMDWLSGEIRKASIARRATAGHSSFRRMTRYEYNYALQDLLGLPWEFARDLPPEAHSEDGFQNSSETLHMSVAQLETYRLLARQALSRATVRGPRPRVLYWGVSMEQAGQMEWKKQAAELEKAKVAFKDDPEKQKRELDKLHDGSTKPHGKTYFKDRTTGRTAPQSWDYGGAKHAIAPTHAPPPVPQTFDHVAILPHGHEQKLVVELGDQVPDEGLLRVRVHAARTPANNDRDPSLQLEFGWQASNEGRALLRVSEEDHPITASPDQPQIYQWDVSLGDIYPRNSVRKASPMGSTPSPSEHIRLVNSSASPGEIQISYVEVAAPVYDQWPPKAHERIFFKSPNREDEPVYAREVLTAFMPRAWRRQVGDEEIDQKVRLFQAMRKSCDTLEEALVEVLATVLSSPEFLYIVRGDAPGEPERSPRPPRLTAQELATRLSMFLWCSVPDDRLLELADNGQLRRPKVLEDEVRRMLADARAERFAKHFVRQWLDLQLLDFVKLEGGVDPLLKEAMQQEPILFFAGMLRRDESVLNFIHADYTMADERLAGHYGLADVYGNYFRRIGLDLSNRRGGLLTQAGLLAMNSSGKDSNPLKRGIWLLKSLLDDPPPPPPPAVPEIDLADPEIAKMTLKERLADHRNHEA